MGSLVDVESVRRHLEALGHSVDSRSAATLLRDLGFDVATEPGPAPTAKQSSGYPHIAAAKTADRTSNAVKQDGLTALAARLEALEAQLGRLGARDTPDRPSPWPESSYSADRLLGECEACSQWAAGARSVGVGSSPRCVLGDEARQLRDIAAGCWPTVAARSRQAEDGRCAPQECSSSPRRSGGGGGGGRQLRRGRADPVARYQ